MRQAKTGWKWVIALFSLLLTVLIWQQGLQESFERPSVAPKISLLQIAHIFHLLNRDHQTLQRAHNPPDLQYYPPLCTHLDLAYPHSPPIIT